MGNHLRNGQLASEYFQEPMALPRPWGKETRGIKPGPSGRGRGVDGEGARGACVSALEGISEVGEPLLRGGGS